MLKNISEYFTYHLIKLHHGTRLADSVEFFIYDTIKIFLLLTIIIFVISVIRSFFLLKRQSGFYHIKKNL